MKPFRWNLQKREQLGGLLVGDRAKSYNTFFTELLECAYKVVANKDDCRLVFVGRSPESIYDLLTGAYEDRADCDRLIHLNMSNRHQKITQIKGEGVFRYVALKRHFCELGLSLAEIIHHPNGLCFVDLVYGGGTYERLFEFLTQWCKEEKHDFTALKRKIRFLGITERSKNSPNTWRWQQHADWVKQNKSLDVKNISVPKTLWRYLGNNQQKVEASHPPTMWGDDAILLPPRDQHRFEALRLAYDVYLFGKENSSRFL